MTQAESLPPHRHIVLAAYQSWGELMSPFKVSPRR